MSDQVTQRINYSRVLQRSCESLLGICVGMLADSKLNEDEVRFLDLWLMENREITRLSPGDEISRRVSEVLADGVVTEIELESLKNLLAKAIGGGFEATGTAANLPTQLPIDLDASIEWAGRTFCFTGKFLGRQRKDCELEVSTRGGTPADNAIKSLNYLVIGSLASPDWKNSTHGRKIEAVLAHRKNGSTTLIISEKQWAQALER